jgi:uncharacterized protein (TIGR02145 family)
MNRFFISPLVLVFISLFLILSGCKKDEAPTAPQNHLPKIESLTANPANVLISTETTLTCIATDEDGDNLTITWSSKRGTFSNGVVGVAVKWVAPSTAGTDTINVTVNDSKQTIQGKLEIIVGSISASPTLISPNNNATEVALSPILTWNAVSNAVSYTLQVSTDNSFSSLVYNQSSLTNTNQLLSGLLPFNKYYWRVNSTNSYGNSNWSNYLTFTTISGPCPGIPTVTYEGKTYNTEQIGIQCWLKENLNVGSRINGMQNPSNNGTVEKYCYNNYENSCTAYGGLYQWNEAMAYSTTPGSRGICPTSWHIPTYAELQTLGTTVNNDSNALKAIGQGSGTNTSGFSALLAGYRTKSGPYSSLGGTTYFWSSSAQSASNMTIMGIYYDNSAIYFYEDSYAYGFSVRCVKD